MCVRINRDVHASRAYLRERIRHPKAYEIAKLILHEVITTAAWTIKQHIRDKYQYDLPLEVEWFIDELYAPWTRGTAKRNLTEKCGSLIPAGQDKSIYRLCEAAETKVMLRLMEALLEEGMKSIVWLHDGIYVYRKDQNGEEDADGVERRIRRIFKGITEEEGMEFHLRREDLEVEYRKAVEEYKEQLKKSGEAMIEPTEGDKIRAQASLDKEERYDPTELRTIDVDALYRKMPKGAERSLK